MRAVSLTLATLLLSSGPAMATRQLSCNFSDENLAFEAVASFTARPVEHFAKFDGKLDIRMKAVPDHLRKREFDLEHLAQKWLYGGDLRLHLRRQHAAAGAEGYVELVIETKRLAEDRDYRGSYVLTIHTVTAGEGNILVTLGTAGCLVD